jgi:hypothetical protein
MTTKRPSYSECDADNHILPSDYLEKEVTRNLRAGLGEELWAVLEEWEEKRKEL